MTARDRKCCFTHRRLTDVPSRPARAFLSKGKRTIPQIAVARDGTLVLAWDEVHGAERRIVVATSSGAGLSAAPAFRRDQSTGDQSGVYPAIALTPTHSIVAWTGGAPAESTIRVLRLPAVH